MPDPDPMKPSKTRTNRLVNLITIVHLVSIFIVYDVIVSLFPGQSENGVIASVAPVVETFLFFIVYETFVTSLLKRLDR